MQASARSGNSWANEEGTALVMLPAYDLSYFPDLSQRKTSGSFVQDSPAQKVAYAPHNQDIEFFPIPILSAVAEQGQANKKTTMAGRTLKYSFILHFRWLIQYSEGLDDGSVKRYINIVPET